ncbi:MAG TPA: hypothetical protein VIN08_15600 [Ohtaekwangia sp.]|uniref:hypothetical protein n=1 Tax=Ohtaekwangia sp. TaxID=2066019 RepID=UPI002F94E283
MSEEEKRLQEKIESGVFSDSPDERVYQQVFNSLEKEPVYTLPRNFASSVVRKIELQQSRSLKREYFWLVAGIIVLLVVMIIATALTGFVPSAGFLSKISGYKGVFLFGTIFIFLLNWIDKKFIRTKQTTL